MEKKIKFFRLNFGGGILVAVRPGHDTLILFREKDKEWVRAPLSYSQMEGDMIYDAGPDFDEIPEEEAQNIFKDIRPEPVLDSFTKFIPKD
jgi:hypothetical protein